MKGHNTVGLQQCLPYIVVFLKYICIGQAEDFMRFTNFELIPSLNEYVIANSSLWVKNNMRSAVDCFVACVEEVDCKSVFYKKLTSDCIGHSSVNTSIATASEDTEYRYYKNLNPTAPAAIASCGADGSNADGQYRVLVGGNPLNIYCDMSTDGGKWLVVQRRIDGDVSFHRTWEEYKNGFGDVNDEFWIGNDNLHYITKEHSVEVRFELNFTDGSTSHAKYSTFAVGDEASKYLLTVAGYDWNVPFARDVFTWNSGKNFSTFDQDNDEGENVNCADLTKGGWWYTGCGGSSPNGQFNPIDYQRGAAWARNQSDYPSTGILKATAMKLRVNSNVDD